MASFKPVLSYKLLFDPSKEEKNKMEVDYTRKEEEGDAARKKILKTTTEFQIC